MKYLFIGLILLAGSLNKSSANCNASSPDPDYFISTNVTWDQTHSIPNNILNNGRINRKIVIQNGARLKIKNLLVDFTSLAQIEVQMGGTLVLESAHLNCSCPEIPGTGINEGVWKGIKVWGDPTQPPTSSAQGKVEMHSWNYYSTISNAYTGINSINGGIVDVTSGVLQFNKAKF